jgi:Mrp family chromosome partitioning ATPase
LNRLAEREDSIVIVDLPAVLDSDAALTAATLCDCVGFAVREGTTTRADLERGLGVLAAVPVLGTVLVDSLTAPVGETVRN